MNYNVVVIEDSSMSISTLMKCRKLEYNNQSKDEEIHKWLILNKEVLCSAEKIVIPVRLGHEDAQYIGLYIGMHLRLTKELENGRYLPIAFISDDSKEEILSNQINNLKEKTGILLFTKKTYLMSVFSLGDFLPKKIAPLDEKELLEIIIPVLNVEISNDPGHQLANDWGAFRLAKFAGCSLSLNPPASLYFKFKNSLTNNEIITNKSSSFSGLMKRDCKALLIDDNASAGWSEVINFILKNRILKYDQDVSLDVISTFDEAQSCDNYLDYDIVFLDLRLLKEEDKGNGLDTIKEFSGAKILAKIKAINKGIQVIIFTASNKVWNIERLMTVGGANGYYVKESPEYKLSSRFSSDNYENLLITINKSLKLGFLKTFYTQFEPIKLDLLRMRNKELPREFVDEVIKWVELSNEFLSNGAEQFNLTAAFLFYFSILENIANNIIDVDNPVQVETVDGLKKYHFQFRSHNQYLRNFIEDASQESHYRKTNGKLKSSRNISWTMKILNTFDFISEYNINETSVSILIKKRNQIIHANATTGEKINIQVSEIESLYDFIMKGLKNIR